MKTRIAGVVLMAALAGAGAAHGQAFVNMNFEQAQVVSNDPTFGFLDWNLAVPGWGHSVGSDTGAVYYGATHVGQTQWFRLLDAQSVGSYAMQFSSGLAYTNPPGAPWVQATLMQTGLVPAGTQSLRLRATGPLQVLVGGTPVPLVALGGGVYGGDVAAYAGQLAELRLVNTATSLFTPVTVDDIVFSASAVPEPPTVVLLGAGLWALLALRRVKPGA